jgi:hypothetical protein
MNWFKVQKIAARISDLEELGRWNATYKLGLDLKDQEASTMLREILGKVVSHINEISDLLLWGSKKPNPKNVEKAKALQPDINNIAWLHELALESENIINVSIQQQKQRQLQPEEQVTPAIYTQWNFILNLLHSVERTDFSDTDKQAFAQIASGSIEVPKQQRAEMMNVQRASQLFKDSIYSIKDPATRTLRVIRETLQNAVDATLKQKRLDPEHMPSVDLTTVGHKVGFSEEQGKMDLMITDNGTGMDWNTLREKFLVAAESGKEESQDAGGFGIANEYIQGLPEDTWTVDTQGAHSSRFHKNQYFTQLEPGAYQTPQSTIQSLGSQGTRLTLYGIPAPYESSIRDLAAKYAMTDSVQISLNGNAIEPRFKLSEVVELDSSLSGITDEVAKNDLEKQIVGDAARSKSTDPVISNIGNLNFEEDGTHTSIRFFVKSQKPSGRVYVFLNGQYQNDSENIPLANIICSIETDARPGTKAYPMDAGREKIRPPYLDQVKPILDSIEDMLTKSAESEILKKGLDVISINKNGVPFQTGMASEERDEQAEFRRRRMHDAFASPNTVDAFDKEDVEEQKRRISEVAQEMAEEENLDEAQKALVRKALEVVHSEKDAKKFNFEDAIDTVINGLTTPAVISIQKDFVSPSLGHERVETVGSILLCWQEVLKVIMEALADYSQRQGIRKSFVPGIVFSNEAVALYMGPKDSNSDHMIMINPIVVSSLTLPDYFNEQLLSERRADSQREAEEINVTDETPINKVAILMFHTAIHEIVHMMHPDWWGHENFHNNISFFESTLHKKYDNVREVVKKYMRPIRREARILITAIKKDKAKREKLER